MLFYVALSLMFLNSYDAERRTVVICHHGENECVVMSKHTKGVSYRHTVSQRC